MGFFTSEAFTTEEARSSGFLWVFISLVTLRRPEGKEGRKKGGREGRGEERREGGREGGRGEGKKGGREGGRREREGRKGRGGRISHSVLCHHQIALYPW